MRRDRQRPSRFDDAASVALATNREFLEIIERSRASLRERGTLTLAQVRKRLAAKAAATRRRTG